MRESSNDVPARRSLYSYDQQPVDNGTSDAMSTCPSRGGGADDVTMRDEGMTVARREPGYCKVLIPFLQIGGTFIGSVFLTTIPQLGAGLALTLSIVGLGIDFVRHQNGYTALWPKPLDIILCITWLVYFVVLFAANPDWMRLYAGIFIMAVLMLTTFISALIRKPWIYFYAVDFVSDRLWRTVGVEEEARVREEDGEDVNGAKARRRRRQP